MINAEAMGRIEAVGSKIKMAKYHLDRLRDHVHTSGDEDMRILWAAEFEGCMHCLHHCFDILGHAINSQLHVTSQKNPYLKDVVVALPAGPLREACEALLADAAWLIAFVNYSKHNNVVPLFRQWYFVTPWQPALTVGMTSFTYKERDFPQIFDAVYHAGSIFDNVVGQVEATLAMLER